jgi:hypothetical protein
MPNPVDKAAPQAPASPTAATTSQKVPETVKTTNSAPSSSNQTTPQSGISGAEMIPVKPEPSHTKEEGILAQTALTNMKTVLGSKEKQQFIQELLNLDKPKVPNTLARALMLSENKAEASERYNPQSAVSK